MTIWQEIACEKCDMMFMIDIAHHENYCVCPYCQTTIQVWFTSNEVKNDIDKK